MDPSDDATYEPRCLRERDLRTPIPAGLKRLPRQDREEMQARREALLDRTAPFGSHMRWRVTHYVVRAVICVPIITWVFTPVGLETLWIQLPLAALYGVAVAYSRPSNEMAGFLLLGTGTLILGLTGYFTISLGTLLALFAFFVCGMFVGVAQWLRRMDGE